MVKAAYWLMQTVNTFLLKGNNYLILLIIISLFFCFWRLGSAPLNEWDESRNGVNAIEMLQNGDYVNLYYDGQPDTWNAKPPLMIWMIAASYAIFGLNEFALRFPSALASFLSLLLFYKLTSRYSSKGRAFFTCLILLTVNGVLGPHVGRTGDFDALLLLFLLLTIYYFLRYIDFEKGNCLLLSAVFLGLAFYTKGLASIIILPGLFFYTLYNKKLFAFFRDKEFWLSALIYLSFITSWYLIVNIYGLKYSSSPYGTESSFHTMWKYDVVERFISGFNDKDAQQDLAFFFNYLDAKFNVWNYLFYLSAIILFVNAIKASSYTLKDNYNKLIVFSCCLSISMGVILSVSAEAHFWYMTPALPFIAIITVAGINRAVEHYKDLVLVPAIILFFTFGRKIVDINSHGSYPSYLETNTSTLHEASRILTYDMNRQDYLLYLKFMNVKVEHTEDTTNFCNIPNELLMVSTAFYDKSAFLKSKAKLLGRDENYCLLKSIDLSELSN